MAMNYNYGGAASSYSMPLIWVENEMDARNTYVPNGSTAFFMERNNQIMYAKSVATNGIVDSFRIFKFTEVTPVQTTPASASGDYVTQNDLKNALDDLKQYLDNTIKSNRRNYNKGENHG